MELVVISGGQTGADRAALEAARAFGFRTGGWMPKGFLAEDGPHPEFAQLYGCCEIATTSFDTRTRNNIRDSDATVVFLSMVDTPGMVCTFRHLGIIAKPFFFVDINDPGHAPQGLAMELRNIGARVLNVAGHRASLCPPMHDYTYRFLMEMFPWVRSY